jgi:hypothetical protein
MALARIVLGVACWALAQGAVLAQVPPVPVQQIDSTKEPTPDTGSSAPARRGVAAPMNMRIRGDGVALPQGVGRHADDQREEQREEQRERQAAPPAPGAAERKPDR